MDYAVVSEACYPARLEFDTNRQIAAAASRTGGYCFSLDVHENPYPKAKECFNLQP